MAILENLMDTDELHRLLMQMSGPELIAQHLVQRGSMFALEQLLLIGVSTSTVHLMLEGLRRAAEHTKSVARERGVELVSED
jgi:hypothetical protein